jgi:hypothetical protein
VFEIPHLQLDFFHIQKAVVKVYFNALCSEFCIENLRETQQRTEQVINVEAPELYMENTTSNSAAALVRLL